MCSAHVIKKLASLCWTMTMSLFIKKRRRVTAVYYFKLECLGKNVKFYRKIN